MTLLLSHGDLHNETKMKPWLVIFIGLLIFMFHVFLILKNGAKLKYIQIFILINSMVFLILDAESFQFVCLIMLIITDIDQMMI